MNGHVQINGCEKASFYHCLRLSIVLFILLCFANHAVGQRFQRGGSMPTCAWVVTAVYTVAEMGPKNVSVQALPRLGESSVLKAK